MPINSSLEGKLIAVSSNNSSVLGLLKSDWIKSAFQVQSARVNDGTEVWVFDNNRVPRKKTSNELRGIDVIAGDGIAYEITDDQIEVYITNPPNNPLLENFGHLADLLKNPYIALTQAQSNFIRSRGSQSKKQGVQRFTFSSYPRTRHFGGYDRHFVFFEGNKNSLIFTDDLFGAIHGQALESVTAYLDGDKPTRIGLLRKSEILPRLNGAERGQMLATFAQLRGVGHSFDVYLGSDGSGYVIAEIPKRQWSNFYGTKSG